MKRATMLIAGLMLSASLSDGQDQSQSANVPFQPAVPPPTMGGYGGGGWGWGGGGGVGSTVQGSAMTGMANVISAKGDYNLATSAAAVNMTQAQKQEIQNRQLYTNTYFEMRETNRQARASEARPRPTTEQLARMAHEVAPKPLDASQVDDVTGQLNWPVVFQQPVFQQDRKQFESLFVSYSQLGSLNFTDQTKARKIINSMNGQLKSQIRSLPSSDYMAARRFLEGLMFTTCRSHLG